MQPAEIAFLKRYLTPTTTVLEWGAGGSTVEFSPLVKSWHSIEHNPTWFERVKEETKAMTNVKLSLVLPEIENPPRPSQGAHYISYIEKPRKFHKKFDLIYIDGRARPECAKEALNHLKSTGIVVIHDFFDKYRPHYKIVLDWYDVIDGIEQRPSIVALKPKR